MADFKIDEMSLTRKSLHVYDLRLRVNAAVLSSHELTGTPVGNSIFFDPGNIGEDEGITLLYPNLNFGNLDKDEVISIYIIDNDEAVQKKKGGISIRDTDYPPPKGDGVVPKHQAFSGLFTITDLLAKRVGTSNEFTISVAFTYNAAANSYTPQSFEFKDDLVFGHNLQDVLIFRTQESAPNGPAVPFTITGGSQGLKTMKLKNYDPGLPFFIFKSNGGVWADVDVKKGMIFVE